MNIRQMANKMLEFFGPDGEKWINNGEDEDGKCCLLQCTSELFHGYDEDRMDNAMRARLPVPVFQFNDRSDWPTVKHFLRSIRDGRKFVP